MMEKFDAEYDPHLDFLVTGGDSQLQKAIVKRLSMLSYNKGMLPVQNIQDEE